MHIIYNPRGRIEFNYNIRKYLSYKVNKVVQTAYWPQDLTDLVGYVRNNNITSHNSVILGLGSNILPRYAASNKTYLLLAPGLRNLICAGSEIYVEAGVTGKRLTRFCYANSLGGAGYWATIPGSLGGFVAMNAGAFGGETWEYLTRVRTLSYSGQLRWRFPSDYTIGYREVIPCFPHEIIVGACFRLPTLQAGEQWRDLQMIKRRNSAQPLGEYSCGSVFRNPVGDYAGRLIESCGLKGFRVGGAEVSTKHANFIINKRWATSEDVWRLISLVQERVWQRFGVKLDPEVHCK